MNGALIIYTEDMDSERGLVPLADIITAEEFPDLHIWVSFENNGREVKAPLCRLLPNGTTVDVRLILPYNVNEGDCVPMERAEE
jgi:hypothetical protein